MTSAKKNPRVLVVTPEVTYLPDRMGNFSRYLTAKAGGLADVSAALISALFDEGADVHVARMGMTAWNDLGYTVEH